MGKNKEEFDINRKSYDDKTEEIRKKKRKLRDIQEPGLVKKIKKDLKVEQRGYKRYEKQELKKYLKDQIDYYTNDSIDQIDDYANPDTENNDSTD